MMKLWQIRRWLSEVGCEQHTCAQSGGMRFKGLPAYDVWRRHSWGFGPWRRLRYWLDNGPVGKWRRSLRDPLWQWVRNRDDFYDSRVTRLVKRIADKWCNPTNGGTIWEWPWQPRTCSYCGGVNPDDAIRLMFEGWHTGGTTKGYKFYMEPPPLDVDGRRWHPVHPVKLYTYHFNEDQLERLNSIARASPI